MSDRHIEALFAGLLSQRAHLLDVCRRCGMVVFCEGPDYWVHVGDQYAFHTDGTPVAPTGVHDRYRVHDPVRDVKIPPAPVTAAQLRSRVVKD
jgi:hypothetical protein